MAKFLVAGDLHGHLGLLEETIQKHPDIDFVLQVGDFGAYFDDGASAKMPRHRRHPSEFPQYASGEKSFSKPVIFIKGNHEGFEYLMELEGKGRDVPICIAKNLYYLPNGSCVTLHGVRVAGLGGNFSPKYLGREVRAADDPLRFRHFRISEINALMNRGNVDILLTHDACPGIVPSKHIMSEQSGHLLDLVQKMQPTYWAIGHYHMGYETSLGRTKVYGLTAIHYCGQSHAILEKR